MSGVTHGMDLAAVEELGRFLQQRGDRLRQIVQEINRAVYAASWEGGVAVQFGQQQWPGHRARLLAAADHLHGLGQSALNNASEQRRASQVTGLGPPGSRSADGSANRFGGRFALLAGAALPLVQIGLGAGDDISQGARLGRYLEARRALAAATGGAAAARAAGRVGGLTTQLWRHARVSKLGTALDAAEYALSVHQHGLHSPEATRTGVGAAGSLAFAKVPGGTLAWTLGYDLIGHELLVERVIEPSFEGTGDDWTGHMFNGTYGDRDLSDPAVAAEVSRRSSNLLLLSQDMATSSARTVFSGVKGWFR